MCFDIPFVGGPKDQQTILFLVHYSGELYATSVVPGVWHYYVLMVKGTCRIPNHYQYLGETQCVLDSVDQAREFFANLAKD